MSAKIKDITDYIKPFIKEKYQNDIYYILECYNPDSGNISFTIYFIEPKILLSNNKILNKIEIIYPYSHPLYNDITQRKQIAKIIDYYIEMHFH